MKKTLKWIFVFTLVLGAFFALSLSSSAYNATLLEGTGMYYSISDGAASIVGADYSIKTAEIPNFINGYPVTSIGDYAFEDCSSLTSVTIPDSVTSIGSYAFSCSSLTSVTIPDSVTSIEFCAFSGCRSLSSVTIGNNVTSIGSEAFSGCTSLESVTIGNNVTSIGMEAFSNCSSLTSVTIPDSVTSIGECAFSGCSSLASVTIPDSVTVVGWYFFQNCSSLESVTIGNGLTGIDEGMFYGCISLKRVTIPYSVTFVFPYAFYGCSSLETVYYTGSRAQWDSITFDSYSDAELLEANLHFTQCEKNGHTKEIIPAVPVTCTQVGLTEGSKCSVCGVIFKAQQTIANKGHSWDSGKVTKTATCTKEGKKVYTCSVCKTTKTKAIAVNDRHDWSDWTKFNGTQHIRFCGYNSTHSEKANHTWDSGKVTKKATYAATGVKTFTCTACGATKTKTIAKLTAPTVAKVGGLTASKTTKSAITLKWKAAKNATKYQVYRSTDNGKTWKKIVTVAKTAYTDKDVKTGANYQYKVRGLHAESKATGAFSAVLKTGTVTAAPTIGKLTSTKSKTATVTWGKVTGAKSYTVYTSTDGKTFKAVKTGVTKTTYTITGLKGGRKVYVKIQAVNAYGAKSEQSAAKSVRVKR